MTEGMPPAEIELTEALIRHLLKTQHPGLADLPLDMIGEGWDNLMVRLGDQWQIRLPIPVSTPVRIGQPDQHYPWHQEPVGLNMIYCGISEFGQMSRLCSLHSGAIRLKRSKNLTQIGFPSRRPVKSGSLLDCAVCHHTDQERVHQQPTASSARRGTAEAVAG